MNCFYSCFCTMKIVYISIFQDIFNSFVKSSLIQKAQDKNILEFVTVDPRDFCPDKHRQVDDEIYGGGAGMLIKAEPVIQAIESIEVWNNNFKIVYMSPSESVFDQKIAHQMSELDLVIFVCGRYEGIDYRFVEYMQKTYPDNFEIISVGQFVTLWGEVPAMLMTEAIARLIPWVIKEAASWQDESYALDKAMNNLEYPQYTRPENVRGMKVPEVLLSGHHKNIEAWKRENTKHI